MTTEKHWNVGHSAPSSEGDPRQRGILSMTLGRPLHTLFCRNTNQGALVPVNSELTSTFWSLFSSSQPSALFFSSPTHLQNMIDSASELSHYCTHFSSPIALNWTILTWTVKIGLVFLCCSLSPSYPLHKQQLLILPHKGGSEAGQLTHSGLTAWRGKQGRCLAMDELPET